MYKNIVVTILGLGVICGLGFLFVNNKKIVEDTPVVVLPEPSLPAPNTTLFNKEVTLKLNSQESFEDGLVVTLKQIDDSRCPEGVMCFWQGELSALIDVSSGKIKTKTELRLGTENYKTQSLDGYIFTLISATEKSINLKVTYEKSQANSGGCFVGGCSGQVCSDQKDVMSTCEYKEEYSCYKTAKCERQDSGVCGWTQTQTLLECLVKYYPGE
jgi:hypothetical protein